MAVILSGAFFLLCAFVLVWKAVTMWRGPGGEQELTVAMAVLSSEPDFRQGMVRAVAVQAASVVFVLLMIVCAVCSAAAGQSVPHAGWGWAVGGCGFAVIASALLQLAVILFNRPRFVVPPHLRGEPGLLASRRAQRQEGDAA